MGITCISALDLPPDISADSSNPEMWVCHSHLDHIPWSEQFNQLLQCRYRSTDLSMDLQQDHWATATFPVAFNLDLESARHGLTHPCMS